MTRRLALAAASAGPFFAFPTTQRANLLFICSDQHQTAAASCYGSTEVHTPHIDEIASDGVRFNRAYCQSPVCVPSRGSIITGQYPHRHGARVLQDPLPSEARTVAHHFADAGYATAAIGKMHFVDETRRHGFEHRVYAADFNAGLTESERERVRRDQGSAGGTTGRRSQLDEGLFRDTYYAREAIRFLHQNQNRPFCLWTSFFMPHTPLVPHGRYWDLYDESRITLPVRHERALESGFEGHLIRSKERGWYQQTDDELRTALRGYYGNVSQMDANVGRVFDALRELGLDKNTVVVYTSDHGEMAGAHRMWTKHNMYEQSVNVPLLVRMPDRMEAGAVRDQMIEQVDLFPTLSELCGLGAVSGGGERLDGRSFAPLVRGDAYTPREFAYSEYDFCRRVFTADDRYVGREPIRMVRTERWKLNYLDWGRSELFDLQNDPDEFHNLIDQDAHRSVVRELTETAHRLYRS